MKARFRFLRPLQRRADSPGVMLLLLAAMPPFSHADDAASKPEAHWDSSHIAINAAIWRAQLDRVGSMTVAGDRVLVGGHCGGAHSQGVRAARLPLGRNRRGALDRHTLLGHDGALKYAQSDKGLEITLPDDHPNELGAVLKISGVVTAVKP